MTRQEIEEKFTKELKPLECHFKMRGDCYFKIDGNKITEKQYYYFKEKYNKNIEQMYDYSGLITHYLFYKP